MMLVVSSLQHTSALSSSCTSFHLPKLSRGETLFLKQQQRQNLSLSQLPPSKVVKTKTSLYSFHPSSLLQWNEIESSLEPTYSYEAKPIIIDSALENTSTKPTFSKTKPTLFRERHGWCPYSERVWLALELKNIPYDTILIDNTGYGRKPSYFAGQTPQIKWEDGSTQGESMDLVRAIDEKYPTYGPSLYHPKGINNEEIIESKIQAFRSIFPRQARPSSRAAFLFNYNGEPLFKSEFERVLNDMNDLLGTEGGPFFCGKEFTAVDIAYIPFLERYSVQLPCLHDNLSPRTDTDKYPHLVRWYNAIEEHVPEYKCRIQGDASSWTKVLTMAGFGNAGSIPSLVKGRMDDVSLQEYTTAISATARSSNSSTMSAQEEEQRIWDRFALNRPWIMDSPSREVCAIIAHNRKAIMMDMLKRNWKSQGSSGSSEIDNEGEGNKKINEEEEVDVTLRALICKLLIDTELSEKQEQVEKNDHFDYEEQHMIQTAASFLDQRMCVPRDMGIPCASVMKRLIIPPNSTL